MPWSDLYISSTNICPSGYLNSYFGIWPGTIHGCGENGILTRDFCFSGDGKVNKSASFSYPNLSPLELYQWNNMFFCIKPINDYYYTTSTCKEGYSMCNPNICYNDSQGCPITNISISTMDYIYDLNTTRKSFTKNTSIIYYYLGHYYYHPPVIDIYYSTSTQQCLDKGHGYNDPNDYYPLINNPPNGCGLSGLDPYYKIIDYSWEYDLYAQNNMIWLFEFLQDYSSFASKRLAFLAQQTKYTIKNNIECYSVDFNAFNQIQVIVINMDYYMILSSKLQIFVHLKKLI